MLLGPGLICDSCKKKIALCHLHKQKQLDVLNFQSTIQTKEQNVKCEKQKLGKSSQQFSLIMNILQILQF